MNENEDYRPIDMEPTVVCIKVLPEYRTGYAAGLAAGEAARGELVEVLKGIQEMAEESLRIGPIPGWNNLYQIEADARAILQKHEKGGGG